MFSVLCQGFKRTLPELTAYTSIDEEVEAVLQPIDTEEYEMQLGILGLVVHNVDNGNGSNKYEIAEADDNNNKSETQLSVLKTATQTQSWFTRKKNMFFD